MKAAVEASGARRWDVCCEGASGIAGDYALSCPALVGATMADCLAESSGDERKEKNEKKEKKEKKARVRPPALERGRMDLNGE